jgi:hypothetical protein
MSEVSGILQAGEASSTARALVARQRGPAWQYSTALAVLALIGGAVGVTIAPRLGVVDPIDGFAPGVVVGALVYLLLARRLATFGLRRTLASRGIATAFPLRLEVTDEALVYELGDVRQIAQWRSITEVVRVKEYWIVIAQATPFFAPRRFFANEQAERRFVADVLAHMPPEARERSTGAADFARFE